MTRRVDSLRKPDDGRPWCLCLPHQPHWPYTRQPYASMYGPQDAADPLAGGTRTHPVLPPTWTALLPHMSRNEAREKVFRPMGLIKQIDDQMGVLSSSSRGLLDTTMIVFTSDHGYLGDHWMGEKGPDNRPKSR
jgi:arylsulfatase A-like enzyme